MEKDKVYKPKEFAELVGVSVRTLQRWDNDGTFKAKRTPSGRRYYMDYHVRRFNTVNEVESWDDDAIIPIDYITTSTTNGLTIHVPEVLFKELDDIVQEEFLRIAEDCVSKFEELIEE